jgi:hypothetical protein
MNPIEACLRDHVTVCRDLIAAREPSLGVETLDRHWRMLRDRFGGNGYKRIAARAHALVREVFGGADAPPLANARIDPWYVVEADMLAERLATECRANGDRPSRDPAWRATLNERYAAMIERHIKRLEARAARRRPPAPAAEPPKLEELVTAAVTRALDARIPMRQGPSGGAIPVMRYMSVWRASEVYEPGDVVTHKGTIWHCGLHTTSKPGTDHTWQMMAKTLKAPEGATE